MSTSTSIFFAAVLLFSAAARATHLITFRSPNLYPEGLAWDPASHNFIVGALRHRSFHSISDAGITSTLLSDPSLPQNSTILGLAVDPLRHRLLAAVTHPSLVALAAYDLRSLTLLFLAPLPSDPAAPSPDVANDVAVDESGNAFVTNSGNNFIWKVNAAGDPSIFSKSPLFTAHPSLDPSHRWSGCGLNGIAYVSGYLLVVQSDTGKLFKVNATDGSATKVNLGEDLWMADGITLRPDGALAVVSPISGGWWVKSDDGFGKGEVERVAVEREGFPTAVAVGGGGRVYVLYGYVEEGIDGNSDREWFRIEEFGPKEKKESLWVFVFVGLGLVYFFFWRFQMNKLVKSMDKKKL